MTDFEPPLSPGPTHLTTEQRELLAGFIREAIDAQDEDDRDTIRYRAHRGELKVTSHWTAHERDDRPTVQLHYLVSILNGDGAWLPFLRVHPSRLHLSREQFDLELQTMVHLSGVGIPDDLSGLTD